MADVDSKPIYIQYTYAYLLNDVPLNQFGLVHQPDMTYRSFSIEALGYGTMMLLQTHQPEYTP